MKPGYGPTLGRLLAPRWHAARPLVRGLVIAAGVGALAAIGALVLTLENATYSHGGPLPFSFAYRGLYKTTPDPGGYVRVARRHADGTLRDSFAVAPLRLPAYTIEPSAELPLYAAHYVEEIRRREPGFELRGEGKTKVNGMSNAYNVFYTTLEHGRELFGRDVLLLPERHTPREGVAIQMLSSSLSGPLKDSPIELAQSGILLRPLKSFSFG